MTGMLLAVLLAVLNSLWQAALGAALVWVALQVFPKFGVALNAATRYAIWWVVLALVLALPAAPGLKNGLKSLWPSRAQTSAAPADAIREPRSVAPISVEPTAPVILPEPKSAKWPWWIFGLCAAVFVYRLDQIGRSYFYLRGLKRRATESHHDMPATERPVRLLLSREAVSPMAVGFLHPAVVLPDSLMAELSAPELEHVLLHEVAHIARRDDWTNLAARLLGAVLALHPVAWWILRQIEREREIACDDWVVARTGAHPGDARSYAESLARLSELRWARKGQVEGNALASGIFGGGSRAGERIELLLQKRREFSARVSRVRVALSVAAMAGFVTAGSVAPNWIAFAQTAPPPAFEVASIRLHDPAQKAFGPISISGSHVNAPHFSVFDLIGAAYSLRGFQITGGPSWIGSATTAAATSYDIAAKAPGDSAVSMEQVRLMLRTLLAERFQLTAHRETKQMSVYALVLGKGGSKLAESPAGGKPAGARIVGDANVQMTASKGTMEQLVQILSNGAVDRPVVDKTGLTGIYDYKLEYSAPSPDPRGPSIFVAVQEQLGLRLEPQIAPIDILVIDHVEKPSEN